MFNINFVNELSNNQGMIIFLNEKLVLDNDQMKIDQQYHGLISKTVDDKNNFSGKYGQIKTLTTTNKNGEIKNIILIGVGNVNEIKAFMIEELGGKIFQTTKSLKIKSLGINTLNISELYLDEIICSSMASGIMLSSYNFEKYFTKLKDEEKLQLNNVEILTLDKDKAEKLYERKRAVIEGIFLARNCISEPANILYPESYSEIILKELEDTNIDVEILGEREMRELGMGALIGVGQGSVNESKLVVMKYNGRSSNIAPVAFVGKGVTFDTGGICIKPSLNMGDMKYDMAGSAAVVGVMKSLALRKAKVNAVGIVGLVENMPSGTAQKPGDVVVTMSGQTAEVVDTDAEGRLVLADAIWYVQEKFNPEIVIDLATLTGAIVVALGNTYAGLFSNDDDLSKKLIEAGQKVNEKLWRMPLHKDYDEMIKSDIADVSNLGSVRGAAGSATAAHFIGRFIKKGVAWAHLDIAGMAWERKGTSLCPKGAVGYGVRLLDQLIEDYYESTS